MKLSVGIVNYFETVRIVVEQSTKSTDIAIAAVTGLLAQIGKAPTHISVLGTFCPHGYQTRMWIGLKTGEGRNIL